jgi:glycosyltransferase involved in cell wall biosynthesis
VSAGDRLRVAYLHVGKAGGGVPRYARILADAAAATPGIAAVELAAGEGDSTLGGLRGAARAGRAARAANADAVHIQWKPADWAGGGRGGPARATARLLAFLVSCRVPVVATLHDVYPRIGLVDRRLTPGAVAIRVLGRRAAAILVHSEEERGRLRGLVPAARVHVVPHFVEDAPPLPDREQAKAELGLEGRRVVTLLGFIVKRKGHPLLIEALARLPEDVTAIVAGAVLAGRTVREDELRSLAAELGVADRVRFLGYVADAELDRVLAATDVAVCPFRDFAASGSLSAWISTGVPIVASDLPAIREYDAISPGAIRRFSPYTGEALAREVAAVLAGLEGRPSRPDPAVERLRERLALPVVMERLLEVYRAAAAAAAPRGKPGRP